MMLTHAQSQLLAFIRSYQGQNDGVSPTYDEMREELGLASKSGVARLIDGLEERGFIRRMAFRARALEVLPDSTGLADFSTKQLTDELVRRMQANREAA